MEQRKIHDKDVPAFLESISKLPYVAVDTETWYNPENTSAVIRYIKDSRGILHANNEPFIMTVSTAADNGFCIEVNKRNLPHIKKFLELPQTKIFANATFDLMMFINMGIEPKGKLIDIFILHNLIDEEDIDENGQYLYGLDNFAAQHLGNNADEYAKQLNELKKIIAKEQGISPLDVSYKTLYERDPELMVMYATSDTRNTFGLFELWYPEIEKQNLQYIYDIEMACIPIVLKIERTGHAVDMAQIYKSEAELSSQLEDLQKQINDLAGRELNVNSTNDIVACFHDLGFDYNKKSDKGNWVLDKNNLKALTHQDNQTISQLASLILDYRRLAKMLNTFIQELKDYYQEDGRIHAHFWQAGTRTGRFSSSEPNLENIDKKDTVIRKCFVPSKDYILVYSDYSQQEYRLLADHANEAQLIEAIKQGYDIHKATAALIFNKPIEEITDEERQKGKKLNFA